MVSIRFHAPAVLAVLLALMVTAARGDQLMLTNGLPKGLIMQEGNTFTITWDWHGAASATGQLELDSFEDNETTNHFQSDILENNLNLTTGHHPWVVTTVKGRTTLEWYYKLKINWGTSSSSSGRTFQIRATDDTSSTTTTSSIASETSSSGQTPQPTPSGSSGLSGGVIAGIVVGALAGIGIFAALIALIIHYRRKSQREKEKGGTADPGSGSGSDTDKKGPDTVEAQYPKPELEAVKVERVYELDGGAQQMQRPVAPTELDSNVINPELSGDTANDSNDPRRPTEAST
ncbi:hypothetical protein F5Y10DRAFT_47825 [Nemania abortiva]|nr:hypothetical protein F5Y10DRAFT_47825 [Nemania abortiva]